MAHKEPPRVAFIAALIAQNAPHAGVHPYACARIAADLVRVANQLRRCYTARCNGWPHNQDAWREIGRPRNERRIARLRARAAALLTETEITGAILIHQEDSRGSAISLCVPSTGNREHTVY